MALRSRLENNNEDEVSAQHSTPVQQGAAEAEAVCGALRVRVDCFLERRAGRKFSAENYSGAEKVAGRKSFAI